MQTGFHIRFCFLFVFLGCSLSSHGTSALDSEHFQTVTPTTTLSTTVHSTTTSVRSSLLGNVIEPETTLFDLYLADKHQGLVLVEYTDEWIEIDSPKDLIDQLPITSNADAIIELVKGRIHGTRALLGVGNIRAHVNTFRLVLELDPSFLPSKELRLDGVLPDPPKIAALRQDIVAAASGDLSEQLNGSFSHRTMASFGRFWANGYGTFVDGEEYEADEYSINAVFGTTRLTAGLLQSEGQRFAGSADFLGVTARTDEQVLTNQDTLRGNRIQVFIPSRARVEFYRAGRLLDVQILDFGVQEIDSTRFPQGSYDVEVIIREDTGNITRERVFLSKSGRLAVRDIPVFNIQAGVLRNEFELLSTNLFQTDVTWRALSFLQLQGGATAVDDLAIGYVNTLAVIDDYYVGAGYHHSNEGNSAVTAESSGVVAGFNFSLTYAGSLRSGAESGDRQARDSYGRFFGERNGALYLRSNDIAALKIRDINSIARKQENFTATISRPFDSIEVRLSATQSARENARERYAFGPTFMWWIVREATQSLRLETSYFETEDGGRSSLFAFYQRVFNPWTYSAQSQVLDSDKSTELRTIGTIGYDTRTRGGTGTRGQFRGELIRDRDSRGIGSAQIAHAAPMIAGSAFAQRTEGRDGNTSVGLTIDSSTLIAGRDLHLSYPPDGEAIVLATIDGTGATEPVQLLVNDSPYEMLTPGKTLAIGLIAFRTYKLRIKPRTNSEIVDYDSEEFTVTLFPGNIVKKTWSVNKIYIGLGRIVDEMGEPIADARVRGLKDYAATDADGAFQGEMTGMESLSVERRGSTLCSMELPKIPLPDYYHDYGDIVCRPSTGLETEMTRD